MSEPNPGDFKIEIKYVEAAIEALASGKKKAEAERVRNFGNAILNVAIKTKKTVEKNEREK